MKDLKWATVIISSWWDYIKEAKKEGRVVGFEGFPPVLRKYEKSLKRFLEAISGYGDFDDFYSAVEGENEEFLIELADFCKQEIIPPPPKRPKKVE
jgi:hypothetical protein